MALLPLPFTSRVRLRWLPLCGSPRIPSNRFPRGHLDSLASRAPNLYVHGLADSPPPFISRVAGAYQTHESRLSVSTIVDHASLRIICSPAKGILRRRCVRHVWSYRKEDVPKGHVFSHHAPPIVCPNHSDPGSVIFYVSKRLALPPLNRMGFTDQSWGFTTRFFLSAVVLGPHKSPWGNRVLVFRSATVRLDSLSRRLDARRQPHTGVSCLSLSVPRLDLHTVDVGFCFP